MLYNQIIYNLSKIQKYFQISVVGSTKEGYKLLKFSNLPTTTNPLLIIMAGCHGEEPAPVLTIFNYYREIFEKAMELKVNLVIYPLINPWGFDRNKRFNKDGLSCNSNWTNLATEPTVSEIEIVKKDLITYKPNVFISLHEDDESPNQFYVYTQKPSRYETMLVATGAQFFPIKRNGNYYDDKVENGIIKDYDEGTAEDLMEKKGCQFSYVTETPSSESLEQRIMCNLEIIKTAIKITYNTTL